MPTTMRPGSCRTLRRLPIAGGAFWMNRIRASSALLKLDLSLCCGNRSGNRSDRAEQGERIVPGRNEATPLPEGSGFVVNGVDHQCATAHEPGRSSAALKSVFDQTCSNPATHPADVGCKLPEQQARHRIGPLTGADRAAASAAARLPDAAAIVPGVLIRSSGFEHCQWNNNCSAPFKLSNPSRQQ